MFFVQHLEINDLQFTHIMLVNCILEKLEWLKNKKHNCITLIKYCQSFYIFKIMEQVYLYNTIKI